MTSLIPEPRKETGKGNTLASPFREKASLCQLPIALSSNTGETSGVLGKPAFVFRQQELRSQGLPLPASKRPRWLPGFIMLTRWQCQLVYGDGKTGWLPLDSPYNAGSRLLVECCPSPCSQCRWCLKCHKEGVQGSACRHILIAKGFRQDPSWTWYSPHHKAASQAKSLVSQVSCYLFDVCLH